jgi:hypothetical protein
MTTMQENLGGIHRSSILWFLLRLPNPTRVCMIRRPSQAFRDRGGYWCTATTLFFHWSHLRLRGWRRRCGIISTITWRRTGIWAFLYLVRTHTLNSGCKTLICHAHRDTKPLYTTNADALVSWFDSGVGHRVWRKVHREHPHVLGPTLLPRRQDDKSNVAGRKRARSTGPVWPTRDHGGSLGHDHIKASKVRQRQAAEEKALKDSVWYVLH